jgi:hypothetical protein
VVGSRLCATARLVGIAKSGRAEISAIAVTLSRNVSCRCEHQQEADWSEERIHCGLKAGGRRVFVMTLPCLCDLYGGTSVCHPLPDSTTSHMMGKTAQQPTKI